MGRSNVITKKRHSRFRVGQVVRALNDGPKPWFLYKNTSQLVCIKRVPRFFGDTYVADLIDFVGKAAKGLHYDEYDLSLESEYAVGERNLTPGTHVQYVSTGRFDEYGQLISDDDTTWICGTIEQCASTAYRIRHTRWNQQAESMGTMTSIVPFERVRRLIKKNNE